MKFRLLLAAGCSALACVATAAGAWSAELVVAAAAGSLARANDEVFVAGFPQEGGVAAMAVAVTSGDPPPRADVVLATAPELLAGCKAGTLQKLDWGAIGGRERLLPLAATDCGVGVVVRSLVLAWDRQKFSATPTWTEFWDVAKVPGKRGLHRGARGNLEFALIADGVAIADVYGTLREPAGIERAFRKLDQLKPYVVWWVAEEEAPRLLASGEVLMTSAPAEGVLAAMRGGSSVAPRDFAVQWAGGLQSVASYAMVAGTAAGPAALRFLGFVGGARAQARLGALAGLGGTALGLADLLGPLERGQSPSAPANLPLGLAADEAFWRDQGARLEQQFAAWLARP